MLTYLTPLDTHYSSNAVNKMTSQIIYLPRKIRIEVLDTEIARFPDLEKSSSVIKWALPSSYGQVGK